ncbi:hypothetical protein ACA29_02825 [Lederbergia galactosidilytica]|uniref:Uncharacterized protein n=1 Tax=Lederbergia galactosidilytica TaxID=217031 RepID=A0A0Q9Y7I5_9BACI|nr:hypothetical protein ACA29_02825 [Lederbergia galactosidilytica]
MMLTLEETYKAVLLKNMFDEELEIWNEKKEEFLLKGIVRNNTILRIALLTMGISAVIFFLLNSIVRPVRELIIWYPLFFFMGGCVALVVMFFFPCLQRGEETGKCSKRCLQRGEETGKCSKRKNTIVIS